MAGPTVTLTFAGDTKDLDKAFNTASSGADKMATSVSNSSRKIRDEGGGALDHVGDRADGAESKFIGLADVIGGTGDIMEGFATGDVQMLAMGFADVAGGIASFVVPALVSLGGMLGTAATAVWGFTTALLANPITWVVVGVVALIAAIVLLVANWDTVTAAITDGINWLVDQFNWLVDQVASIANSIWTWITDKVGGAWKWVIDKATEFWDWLMALPGKIGSALATVATAISAPFKAAFNFIADAWNNTVGSLSWTVPDWVPFIGGNTISAPRLPRFHAGGVVGGVQGSEMLAVLQAGERVIPRGMAGMSDDWSSRGDVYVTVMIDGKEFKGMVQTEIKESNRSTRSAALAGRGRA